MDDLNQLEKQMQPKIAADRDKGNVLTGLGCFMALCLAGGTFPSIFWLQIVSIVLFILSLILGIILVFRWNDYEA